MNWIVRATLSVAVATCFSLVSISTWAGPGSANVDSQIDEAGLALENRDYGKVVDLLQPFDGKELEKASMVQVQYLLGSAKFRRTDLELKNNREKGLQKKDKLKENQVDSLRAAFGHFKSAHDLAPEGALAPECLYMTGKVLDWGYMQRFQESLDNYSATYESYPGTEFGVKAKESYASLRPKMSPHHRNPEMKLGTPSGKSH